ncbi:MAG: ribonuclease P protein component [Nitrospiraceae bacterium]|nr:ribonuclease P protein component [Nitrospiraceae bacterium]
MKFLAAAAKKAANGSPFSCRLNTLARKPFGFPRSSRLTREADLESVRRTGKRMQTERLEARASASLLLHPRVGVVVPKYRRNIVDRNRTKRRLRELARTRILPIAGSIDVLLRAKPEAYSASFDQLAVEVDSIAQWAAGIGSH